MRYFKPKHKPTRKAVSTYFQGYYYKDKWDLCKYNIKNKISCYYYFSCQKKCVGGCDAKNGNIYNKSKYKRYNRYKRYKQYMMKQRNGNICNKPNYKRYKRYMKQRNRKKYNLKQLIKYNKPKLINHCIFKDISLKCYFCHEFIDTGNGDYLCEYRYNSSRNQMFGRILYFPEEKKKFCHDCSQEYIKKNIIFQQLKNTKYLPYDCWEIIKDFISKKKKSIYKFCFIEKFHCASCKKYIEGSKGNRIKCSTVCEILKRKNQFYSDSCI